MKIRDFAFAADKNYVMQLKVAVASLLHACRKSPREMTIHVLDLGIGDEGWTGLIEMGRRLMQEARFERHPISAERYRAFKIWNGSLATYARLELATLLPHVDWCFYFDCDVFILNDPIELEPLCRKDIALIGRLNLEKGTDTGDGPWLIEHSLPFDKSHYVCAGVLLMNLDYIRRHNLENQFFEFLGKYPNPYAVDQTVLNVVCFGHIERLPSGWGVFSREALAESKCECIHFSGKSPWNDFWWWFHYCGEHRLADIWRTFALQIAKCQLRRHTMRETFRDAIYRLIGPVAYAMLFTISHLRLYPRKFEHEAGLIRRRRKAKTLDYVRRQLSI